jgi:prepilin-type N-terminal cleavage/methylation domain-containing protein
MKKGFGLLEVLVSAVVLGFLLVGLNLLQKGNRESVLRVRVRDGASTVAQDIIDSISAIGSASLKDGTSSLLKERVFTGSNTGDIHVTYDVTLIVKEGDGPAAVNDQTDYIKSLGSGDNMLDVKHRIAKQVEVKVAWKFKNSDQSIIVSSLVK